MADEYERIIELPLASAWDGEIPQDKAGGITERVPVALVEAKLLNLGFVKLPQVTPGNIGAEPFLGNTVVGTFFLRAVNSVRSWVASIPWGSVDKTGAVASDVGAEPALGNPGAGNWFLRTIAGVRSWVASIPWASVDKSGAVASDVGAWPEISLGGAIDFHNINSGLTCIAKINGTSYANTPYLASQLVGYGGLLFQSKAANGNLKLVWLDGRTSSIYTCGFGFGIGWGPWVLVWDEYSLPAGTTGKALLAAASQAAARSAIGALAAANPTATGTLTVPDVKATNTAGTGTRPASLDSTGKLVTLSKADFFQLSSTPGSTTFADVTNWLEDLVDEAHYKCAAFGTVASATATYTEFRFVIGGVSLAPIRLYSKGDFAVNFDVTTIGSICFVCATIGVYANFVTVHQEVANPSFASGIGIRLQVRCDDDNALLQGRCTRLERLQ